MKNMKMKTKMILGFVIPVVLTIINVLIGDLSSRGVIKAENPERYLENSSIFTAVIAIVSVVITVFVAASLIKAIDRSMIELSNAAKEIGVRSCRYQY